MPEIPTKRYMVQIAVKTSAIVSTNGLQEKQITKTDIQLQMLQLRCDFWSWPTPPRQLYAAIHFTFSGPASQQQCITLQPVKT